MRRLDELVGRRQELAQLYTAAFAPHPFLETPHVPDYAEPNFQSYALRLAEAAPVQRNEVLACLLARGVAAKPGIMTIHREPAYRGRRAVLPIAERASDRSFLLPLYPALTEAEQDTVITAVMDAVEAPSGRAAGLRGRGRGGGRKVSRELIVIGAGGGSRELLEFIADINASLSPEQCWQVSGVLDDDVTRAGGLVAGVPVVGTLANVQRYRGRTDRHRDRQPSPNRRAAGGFRAAGAARAALRDADSSAGVRRRERAGRSRLRALSARLRGAQRDDRPQYRRVLQHDHSPRRRGRAAQRGL